MRVRVPDDIRRSLRERVGKLAEEAGWLGLRQADRSRLYRQWTEDPNIGGVLERFLSADQIRTYIKDTVVKPYARSQLDQPDGVLDALGLARTDPIWEHYRRPHGVRLEDGRIVTWGRAEDWKQVVTAAFERSYRRAGTTAYAVVLRQALGKFEQPPVRKLVEAAAGRLGIARVVWTP